MEPALNIKGCSLSEADGNLFLSAWFCFGWRQGQAESLHASASRHPQDPKSILDSDLLSAGRNIRRVCGGNLSLVRVGQSEGRVLGNVQVLADSSLQWSPLEKAGGNESQCREEL